MGRQPQVESDGELENAGLESTDNLADADVAQLARHFMNGNERLAKDLDSLGACDTSYGIENFARFRVNIFKQNGNHAIVMRKLSSEIPTLAKLGLPPIFTEIIKEKTGIVFVTGATGSGKTTTLAAMLNELNEKSKIHVVTLEDPIEFLHSHKKAVFSQRELGKDFPTFASGLRAALRQAPKAILVGEIRDRETMEIALTAAETGHVVYSTLHTINAGQTINRILGMFSNEEQQAVRERLAETLRFIISQRLVRKIGGGRLLVSEIMGNSLRTKEALLYGENEERTFQGIIEAAVTSGWHSFDQSLLKAYENDLIDEETVMISSTYKNKMRRDLDMAKKLKGVVDKNAPSGMRLDVVLPPAAKVSAR
ncbi:MAG: PilT/PilU family type 4a pilus ATPase [Verrucomicrobiota bacterium]|nr:PilT/PilU family type 4a pilus ATPase [Verrucomicrobiota bacterium]